MLAQESAEDNTKAKAAEPTPAKIQGNDEKQTDEDNTETQERFRQTMAIVSQRLQQRPISLMEHIPKANQQAKWYNDRVGETVNCDILHAFHKDQNLSSIQYQIPNDEAVADFAMNLLNGLGYECRKARVRMGCDGWRGWELYINIPQKLTPYKVNIPSAFIPIQSPRNIRRISSVWVRYGVSQLEKKKKEEVEDNMEAVETPTKIEGGDEKQTHANGDKGEKLTTQGMQKQKVAIAASPLLELQKLKQEPKRLIKRIPTAREQAEWFSLYIEQTVCGDILCAFEENEENLVSIHYEAKDEAVAKFAMDIGEKRGYDCSIEIISGNPVGWRVYVSIPRTLTPFDAALKKKNLEAIGLEAIGKKAIIYYGKCRRA